MSEVIFYAFALGGAVYAGYMIGGHGLPWVWAKLKSIVGSVKADVVAVNKDPRAPSTTGATGATGPAGRGASH